MKERLTLYQLATGAGLANIKTGITCIENSTNKSYTIVGIYPRKTLPRSSIDIIYDGEKQPTHEKLSNHYDDTVDV